MAIADSTHQEDQQSFLLMKLLKKATPIFVLSLQTLKELKVININ
jgi:hypothetical protein